MRRFSHATQLLYSQLLDELRALSIPQTRGISFSKKDVNGYVYWYVQYTVGAVKKQSFIGPDSDELRHLIENFKKQVMDVAAVTKNRQGLVKMLKHEAYSPLKGEFRILQMLDTTGYFRAGGILVGSHAFFSYSNMLGVSFHGNDLRTSDIDLVPDKAIMVALSNDDERSLRDQVLGSDFGFFEVPKLNHKHPSTSFKSRKEDIKLDIITPMRGATSHDPVYIRSIDGYADPVRFLDYLLDDVQQAAIIEGSGLLVSVPHPARYALHKLVVCSRRPAADTLKKRKDAQQSDLLIDILRDDDPGGIVEALEAAGRMPPKFIVEMKRSLHRLLPKNQAVLNDAIQDLGL